jgi:RNA recognition motif-containing protein
MKIYVGNLSPETSEEQLRALFAPHGLVKRARLAKDKDTGEPRGFGYVQMSDDQAAVAIAALHATAPAGRRLKVRQAKSRLDKPGDTGATPHG